MSDQRVDVESLRDVAAPVALDGVVLRIFGSIFDQQPPTNSAAILLHARIDAWSTDWADVVRGPGKTLASQALGRTAIAEAVNGTAELDLELSGLRPFQLVTIGIVMSSFVLVTPSDPGTSPNATALAWGDYWRVPSMTLRFSA